MPQVSLYKGCESQSASRFIVIARLPECYIMVKRTPGSEALDSANQLWSLLGMTH